MLLRPYLLLCNTARPLINSNYFIVCRPLLLLLHRLRPTLTLTPATKQGHNWNIIQPTWTSSRVTHFKNFTLLHASIYSTSINNRYNTSNVSQSSISIKLMMAHLPSYRYKLHDLIKYHVYKLLKRIIV